MDYDFLIIGGGPAGMAAGMQAARLGMSPVIVERDRLGGQALAAPWIENYPGFPNGISGKDLMTSFKLQIKKWSVPVIYDEVIDIEKIPPHPPLIKGGKGGFKIHTSSEKFCAKTILLALGLKPKLVGLKNELPYADPARVDHKGKNVLIVGSGDAAFDLAWSFAAKAKGVTVAIRADLPDAMPSLVERALGRGVKIKTNRSLSDSKCDIAISCAGKTPSRTLLGQLTEKFGKFELNPGEVPQVGGFYLAGDFCRGDCRHISIAAGDGIAAAEKARRFLRSN